MVDDLAGEERTVKIESGELGRPVSHWVCSSCHLHIPTTTTCCPQDGTAISAQQRPEDWLSNSYEFIDTIGSGGMSVIYKARQISLNKIVAIKMLHSHLLTDQSVLRFQQEARAVSRLNHPNIIAVHDFGISEQGQPYMVMDFIDGFTLTQLISRNGALPLPMAMDIFIEVASALSHAHEHGILHRDLKPSNVMLSERKDGTYAVYLVDFGIAKINDSGNDGIAQQLTSTGEVLGSPLYMSPEQCMGKKLEPTTDIYSFGCILYEAVVGVPPHRGATMIETIFKHLNEAAQPLRDARPDISFPQAFDDLTMKLLRTNPAERYQTMTEVKQLLFEIQGGALAGRQTQNKTKAKLPIRINKIAIFAAISASVFVSGLALFLSANSCYQKARESNHQSARKLRESRDLIAEANRRQRADSITPAQTGVGLREPTLDNLLRLDPRLKELCLEGTSVTNAALFALPRLTQLQTLILSDTKISDPSMRMLLKTPSLETLELNNTKLSPEAIAQLAALPKLTVLRLDGTATDDAALLAFSKMQKLTVLDLRDTAISDTGLACLANSPHLAELAISGTKISNEGLRPLSHLKLLRLDMWDTNASGGVLEILKDCKTLQHLTVSRVNLNSSDFAALSTLKTLKYLQLYHIHTIRRGDVRYLVGLKSLRELYIEDCPITDDDADYLKQMTQLTGLALCRTRITDLTLLRLVTLQELTKFWLEEADIGDAGTKGLRALNKLAELYVSGSLISDSGLAILASAPSLSSVEVYYCPNVSRRGLVAFKKIRPNCSVKCSYTD